jgi:trigger factor
LEGITLSSADTIETTPNPEANAAPEQPEHGHDHDHDHAHDHEHHQHGPSLNPECTREVEIEVSADEVSKAFRTVTRRYQKQARIPGFRAGKVPESLIRSRFADGLRQDVVEAVLPTHFREAIDKAGLKPISQPQVTDLQLEDGQPLKFKAVFEVLPEISVDGYQDVHVAKPDTELTDTEFNAELDRVRDSRSTMEPVTEDRALADGDWTQITFRGEIKGEGEPPETEPQPVTGDDVMIEVGGQNTLPAFNEALRGSKPGQELKFEVSYPEDFGERRLAGKTVSYDVEVKAIKKKIQPELTDEFAKELGEYEGIEDFKQKLKDHLANDKKRKLEGETRDKIVEALIAKYQFPIPESLVQHQVDARLDRGLRALAQQGMRTEDMRKLDFNRLRDAQHDSAVNEVKGSLLLDRIADEEKIEVTDSEVDRELELLSLQMREPLDTLRKRLTDDGSLARIREQIRREKTGSLLYEKLAS